MKMIIVSVLSLAFTAAFADARIEILGNFCHAPWDAGNVDNEAFLSGCGGVVNVRNGTAVGYAHLVHNGVSKSMVDPSLDPQDLENSVGTESVSVSGEETGVACVLVDSNGTEYQSQTWNVVTTTRREQERWRITVEYRIECHGGQPVEQ